MESSGLRKSENLALPPCRGALRISCVTGRHDLGELVAGDHRLNRYGKADDEQNVIQNGNLFFHGISSFRI